MDDFGVGDERVLEASVARRLAEKRERETGQQDKTRPISGIMEENSDKSREYWGAMRHGQDGELN